MYLIIYLFLWKNEKIAILKKNQITINNHSGSVPENEKWVIVSWNAGTNRALLCKSSVDGQNQVLQIGRPHTTENEDELQRLAALGERLVERRVAVQEQDLTRCHLALLYRTNQLGWCEWVSRLCPFAQVWIQFVLGRPARFLVKAARDDLETTEPSWTTTKTICSGKYTGCVSVRSLHPSKDTSTSPVANHCRSTDVAALPLDNPENTAVIWIFLIF